MADELGFRLTLQDRAQFARDMGASREDIKGLGSAADEVTSKFEGSGSGLEDFSNRARKALAAFAGASLKAFDTWHKGAETLQVQTGAMGADLDSLLDSMRNTGRGVTQTLDEVGGVLAFVNTKTDLTGLGLERLSTRLLHLSDITDTDARGSTETYIKLLDAWDVKAGDMANRLDILLRASQETGVGILDIATNALKATPYLDDLNFTLEEAIALAARAGGGFPQVLAGIRYAISALSKDEDVKNIPKTFGEIVNQIERAGSEVNANRVAIELFGSRVGPYLAGRIREGSLEYEDFALLLENGTTTIEEQTKSLLTWSDRWAMMRNRFTGAIGPIGDTLGALAAGGEIGLRVLGRMNREGGSLSRTWSRLKAPVSLEGLGSAAGGARAFGAALLPVAGYATLATAALLPTIMAVREFNEAQEEQGKSVAAGRDLVRAWGQQLKSGEMDVNTFTQRVQALAESEGETSDATMIGARILHRYNEAVIEARDGTDRGDRALREFTTTTVRFGRLGRKAFGEWRAEMRSSLSSVGNVLDRFSSKHKFTTTDVVRAFRRQFRAMKDYEHNWKDFIDRDYPAWIVKQVGDMGLEGAHLLGVLANAHGREKDRIVRYLRGIGEGAADVDSYTKEHYTSIETHIKRVGDQAATSAWQVDLLNDALYGVDLAGPPTPKIRPQGPPSPKPKGRARGGDIRPRQWYVVGEEGPELLRLSQAAGRVSSHKESKSLVASGGDISVRVYLDGRDVTDRVVTSVEDSGARGPDGGMD